MGHVVPHVQSARHPTRKEGFMDTTTSLTADSNSGIAEGAARILTFIGASILVLFVFCPWLAGGPTGLALLRQGWWLLIGVPIAGMAVLWTAATRSRHARLTAIIAGLAVVLCIVGSVLFDLLELVSALVQLTPSSWTWLLFGGSAAVLVGAAPQRRWLRAVGGIAILLGFFAPWSEISLFWVLCNTRSEEFFPIAILAFWLVPVGGVLALAYTAVTTVRGKRLAIAAGLSVFASYALLAGTIAVDNFGWGAWMTLVLSAMAVVTGLVAPSRSRGNVM
jgi:hypothetical protein